MAVHRLHRLEGGRPGHQRAGRPDGRRGQRQVKRVIAEMGGKNADHHRHRRRPRPGRPGRRRTPPSATAARSARRAPRVIVVGDVYDDVCRAAGRGDRRPCASGTTADMATDVGPLIDADAHARVRGYIEQAGRRGGWSSAATTCRPRAGSSARRSSPTWLRPASRWRRDEIFGPVLTVLRAGDARPRHRAGQRHRLRPDRRRSSPAARRPSSRAVGAPAGRQRVRQPRHHRRGGRPPALRRLRAVGCGLQGGWPGLPAAVRGAPGDHREHPPPGLRPDRVTRAAASVPPPKPCGFGQAEGWGCLPAARRAPPPLEAPPPTVPAVLNPAGMGPVFGPRRPVSGSGPAGPGCRPGSNGLRGSGRWPGRQ